MANPDNYFLSADSETYDLLKSVIHGFPRFSHIDPEKITLLFKVAKKCRWVGETRKMTPREAVAYPNKELIISLFRPNWESLNHPMQVAVFYHELMHIAYDAEKDKYSLVRHDVEDFTELVTKLGFGYENAAKLLEEMNAPETGSADPDKAGFTVLR